MMYKLCDTCPYNKGEQRNNHHKLTDEQVLDAFYERHHFGTSYRRIGYKYDVSVQTISNMFQRKNYTFISMERIRDYLGLIHEDDLDVLPKSKGN